MQHGVILSFSLLGLDIGLLAYWLVKLIRGFGCIQSALIEGRKPWACNVCMSFWTTALVTDCVHTLYVCTRQEAATAFSNSWLAVPSWLVSLGVCLYMLNQSGSGATLKLEELK